MGGVTEGHLIGTVLTTGSVIFDDKLSDIFPCMYQNDVCI